VRLDVVLGRHGAGIISVIYLSVVRNGVQMEWLISVAVKKWNVSSTLFSSPKD